MPSNTYHIGMTTPENHDPNAPTWDAFTAPDLSLIEEISHYPVALIGDVLQRMGMMASESS